MQALETYPPYNESLLVGNPERDYNHVREYKHDNHRRIGTLSQSEWDVICEYETFDREVHVEVQNQFYEEI